MYFFLMFKFIIHTIIQNHLLNSLSMRIISPVWAGSMLRVSSMARARRQSSVLAPSIHVLNRVFAIAAQRSKPRPRDERRHFFPPATVEPVTQKMVRARITEESGFGSPGREQDRATGDVPTGSSDRRTLALERVN